MLAAAIKELLKPQEYVESILQLDLLALKKQGIKALLINMENTLLPVDQHSVSIRVWHWIYQVKEMGIKPIIFTNTFASEKIKNLAAQLQIDAYYGVFKPFTVSLKRIIRKELGLRFKQVAVVGDQLLGDVLAGNLSGAYTILIKNCDSVLPEDQPISVLKHTKQAILEEIINPRLIK